MKLLLDENLSPRLVTPLSRMFPGSRHVEDCGLDAAEDEEIWRYALDHGFAIVSKDSDFYDLAVVRGSPPKVIWLRVGNSSTDEVRELLQRIGARLARFGEQDDMATLIVMRSA